MIRKALIVGIDRYQHLEVLSGCVNDAVNMERVLKRHEDNSLNFVTPKLIKGEYGKKLIMRSDLKSNIVELFSDDSDLALFYFSGHGYAENNNGYICTGEINEKYDGFSLSELMDIASNSMAKNIVIILDCCSSGKIAEKAILDTYSEIRSGITIIAACTARQSAMEEGNGLSGGVFTKFLVDALEGAAANLTGEVTVASAYAHIEQALGPWKQRPVFKANVNSFVSLRTVNPKISQCELKELATLFSDDDVELDLDPTFISERDQGNMDFQYLPNPDSNNVRKYKILEKLVKLDLVNPSNQFSMWHAAMFNKSCKLTKLGKYYRKLVKEELI